jgi:hypothetical protein
LRRLSQVDLFFYSWYQSDGTYQGDKDDFKAGWAAVAAAVADNDLVKMFVRRLQLHCAFPDSSSPSFLLVPPSSPFHATVHSQHRRPRHLQEVLPGRYKHWFVLSPCCASFFAILADTSYLVAVDIIGIGASLIPYA